MTHSPASVGLDYLAYPTGAIRQAQALAATAVGAEQTWFLVNGTSCGIHAAVMATCGPGDCLMLARNCHQSAFAAAVFAGKNRAKVLDLRCTCMQQLKAVLSKCRPQHASADVV